MSNFMSENPVNLIGPPTVIAVLHVQRSATKVSICEMALLVLGEETKESTISTTTVFNIIYCAALFLPALPAGKPKALSVGLANLSWQDA